MEDEHGRVCRLSSVSDGTSRFGLMGVEKPRDRFVGMSFDSLGCEEFSHVGFHS